MKGNISVATDERSLGELLAKVRKAQEAYARFSQEQVDEIFRAAALKANDARILLAKMAVEETGMGVFEDKVLKNHYASEYIYHRYKDEKTCGVVERDEVGGYIRIAEPCGVVAAIVPTTNPTSTAIFKALLCLKTRNGLIFAPHPRAKRCTLAAAEIVLRAAVEAGAPIDLIGCIAEPSVALSSRLMQEADLILATGGGQMVRAAYSSGKPAVGVGAGNTPALIDGSADIRLAVSSVLHSKTFDNGVICASEQAVIVAKEIYEEVKAAFIEQGGYWLSAEETQKVREGLLGGGKLNARLVGQTAVRVAEGCGVKAEHAKVLLAEVSDVGEGEVLSKEKLSPVLAVYRAEDFEDGLNKAEALVLGGGNGHTAAIYLDERAYPERLSAFAERMKACRILVNTPAAQGGIGDMYNFRLRPSLTLGCGSWGGNSTSENVGVAQLLNVKTVALRRENTLWFRAPQKLFFDRGSLRTALREVAEVYGAKRAFIVTDEFLYRRGDLREVLERLDELGVAHTEFFDVTPDPTLACVEEGAARMERFQPDVVLAFGGGSPMDAAKVMWVKYEEPNTRFSDLAARFMDIRKRIAPFPKLGKKAIFVAVPTTAGTGSEVTPFAVITDEKSGAKYPLADYEMLPTMAVCDADFMTDIPPRLTANAGFDALSHAVEAVGSVMASDCTNGLAYEAVDLLVRYLPLAYEGGARERKAREKVANAATMAGLAFANAFLGVCHSMAHKLGARWKLPHGLANALLLTEVMRFNAEDAPTKMGTFPKYAYPDCLRRYARLAEKIGCEGDGDEALFRALLGKIEEIKTKLGFPKTLREAIGERGTEEEFLAGLDEMCLDAFDDQCTGANPRYPLVEEIRTLYLRAYYGAAFPEKGLSRK